MFEKDYISTAEAAETMGISRQAVLKKINEKKIKAKKVGRNYIINRTDLPVLFGDISTQEKKQIDRAVDKVFDHYEETLKKLSKE